MLRAYLWFVLAALVICLVVATYVLTQVPLSTSVSYHRLSRSFDVPTVGLGLMPLVLGLTALKGREPATKVMPGWEKVFLVVVGGGLALACVAGQVFLASAYLAAGQASTQPL